MREIGLYIESETSMSRECGNRRHPEIPKSRCFLSIYYDGLVLNSYI